MPQHKKDAKVKMKQYSVALNESLLGEIDALATELHWSRSMFIRAAIYDYIASFAKAPGVPNDAD